MLVDVYMKEGSGEIDLGEPGVGEEAIEGIVVARKAHLVVREARIDVPEQSR